MSAKKTAARTKERPMPRDIPAAPSASPAPGAPGARKPRPALRAVMIVCGASLALGLAAHGRPHFGFDGFFGFHALLGFAACAVLVLVAGLFGEFLGRGDDYYDR
jgi:hypothetical protein